MELFHPSYHHRHGAETECWTKESNAIPPLLHSMRLVARQPVAVLCHPQQAAVQRRSVIWKASVKKECVSKVIANETVSRCQYRRTPGRSATPSSISSAQNASGYGWLGVVV
eukprot:TRINITY_DN1761_c1_g1_i6.p2 TRINITY_DN1761_c1_g1~~TRINITY_DN1761_c1_g1_i6.p2  ORF type:complete len:112 (-),score=20.99 TRINITY_DN1761_c1_g1_i6:285-620(-)